MPTLRLAIAAPASLDPSDLDTPDSLLLASQIFDGLVEYDPETAALVPAIAESWDVLEGGRAFTFHLREGVTFHDGTPVGADSFVAAWNRLADPIAANPFAFLLEGVEGFAKYQEDLKVTRLTGLTATSPTTLEVRLSRAWPDFVSLLAHPALSPVPAPAPAETFSTQPIGTGPYRLVGTLTPGSPVRLEAYLGYYGAPAVVPVLEYLGFTTPEEAWPEFLGGGLDLAEIPGAVLPDATSRFGSQGIAPVARVLYCAFNETDQRFQDRRLRTAVSLALDREKLVVDVYGGLPQPATSLVPPTIPGHRADACGDLCAYDPGKASTLVQQVPKKSRRFFLDYAASPAGDRLATTAATELEAVGLHVTPRPHDAVSYEAILKEGGQDLFCLVWVADYPRQQAFLEPLLSSTSVDNLGKVDDPTIDVLLEEARLDLNATRRAQGYGQVEAAALGAGHLIPLLWFRSHFAVQPGVEGLAVDPLGRYDAARLTLAG